MNEQEVKHLWEVEHDYYCNEGNFFKNGVGVHYTSWASFYGSMGDSDPDMNLLFRWDWEEEDQFCGDDYYRNGILKLFWMGQRKGYYFFSTVDVCRADEPEVIKFLTSRFEHLAKLWAPIYN